MRTKPVKTCVCQHGGPGSPAPAVAYPDRLAELSALAWGGAGGLVALLLIAVAVVLSQGLP